MKIRDRFWLWGQDPGSHHACLDNLWKLPRVNRMDTAEGAAHLGISNCCRVVMLGKPEPPFDAESEKMKNMRQVVWSIIGDLHSKRNDTGYGDIDEIIRQAKLYPNITGGVLDDFFGEDRRALFPPRRLAELRPMLRSGAGRPLDLWVVVYEHTLGVVDKACLDECDVITFWTWRGDELANLDRNLDELLRLTPGKRRLAGCYLWNYGEAKPMTIAQMEYQCGKYLQWMRQGDLEGIIFCSNCIADIGLETVEWTRDWIRAIGEEEI